MRSVFLRTGFLPGIAQVLLVTADYDVRESLGFDQVEEGFELVTAPDREQALKDLDRCWIDAVLMDAASLGAPAVDLCRSIRRESQAWLVPLLVLARGLSTPQMVRLMATGADDFVTLPTPRSLLAARVKAAIRRRAALECDGRQRVDASTLRCGGIVVHPERYEVLVEGRPVRFTLSEFRLLQLLIANPGRVMAREQIAEAIHGRFPEASERAVDSLVSSVRKKLGRCGGQLETVRGLGYRMQPQVDSEL